MIGGQLAFLHYFFFWTLVAAQIDWELYERAMRNLWT